MSKRNSSKKTSMQIRKMVKHSEESKREMPSTNESENASDNDDDNNASFQSAATNTDQSRYSFDYGDTSQTEKRSRNQQDQLNTAKPKQSSSTQNKQQNEEEDSSDDDSPRQHMNMGVMLTAPLHEVETDTDTEDDFKTSSISNENDQPSNASEMSKRQSVDRNRVEPQTQGKSRKMRKAKKNMDELIAAYKESTTNLIPKLPFQRLSIEILRQHGDFRFTKEALNAVQECSELYLTHLFEDSYRLALHRNKVTLKTQDMDLVLYLRNIRNN